MSTVPRARSQSHSTCVQRQFACSEQKWSFITEQMEGENMSIEQSSFFLKQRICVLTFSSSLFIPFDVSSDMHFHVSFNKDSSMVISYGYYMVISEWITITKFRMEVYTGCPRRNVQYFGRVFLRSNYNDITQNTYVQISMVTEILAQEIWNFESCYILTDYQTHFKTGRNMWFL